MTVVVCNFTPVVRHSYRFGVPRKGTYVEVFNSDATAFGGSNVLNEGEFEARMCPCTVWTSPGTDPAAAGDDLPAAHWKC